MRLHPKFGLNPSLDLCFYCLEDKGIVLAGAATKEEAPRKAVWDREPCEKCAEYMKQGVILISVKDPFRRRECTECKHRWTSPVRLAKHTANLSGETTPCCPKCNSNNVASGPIREEDPNNPYRTGGWAVVREEFLRRVLTPGDTLNAVIEKRFAFIPSEAWEMLGLPELPKEN